MPNEKGQRIAKRVGRMPGLTLSCTEHGAAEIYVVLREAKSAHGREMLLIKTDVVFFCLYFLNVTTHRRCAAAKQSNKAVAGASPWDIINNVGIKGKIHSLLCISSPISLLVEHFSYSCGLNYGLQLRL